MSSFLQSVDLAELLLRSSFQPGVLNLQPDVITCLDASEDIRTQKDTFQEVEGILNHEKTKRVMVPEALTSSFGSL